MNSAPVPDANTATDAATDTAEDTHALAQTDGPTDSWIEFAKNISWDTSSPSSDKADLKTLLELISDA